MFHSFSFSLSNYPPGFIHSFGLLQVVVYFRFTRKITKTDISPQSREQSLWFIAWRQYFVYVEICLRWPTGISSLTMSIAFIWILDAKPMFVYVKICECHIEHVIHTYAMLRVQKDIWKFSRKHWFCIKDSVYFFLNITLWSESSEYLVQALSVTHSISRSNKKLRPNWMNAFILQRMLSDTN